MKLFLASEAKHPDTIAKLESYIGGFGGKSIAYVPTASNGEQKYGVWKEESPTWKLINNSGAKATAIELEDYKNSSVIKQFNNKDLIWFAGGMPGYLMYWIRRCELDKALPEILAKGSIFVGSSAGSMVCSKTLELTEWYIGENEIGSGIIPGLGLVDFEIYPHYEDALYEKIKSKFKGNKIYLLKNGEEIIVEDNKVTVSGEERILENSTS